MRIKVFGFTIYSSEYWLFVTGMVYREYKGGGGEWVGPLEDTHGKSISSSNVQTIQSRRKALRYFDDWTKYGYHASLKRMTIWFVGHRTVSEQWFSEDQKR